jgi:hypothetical protein
MSPPQVGYLDGRRLARAFLAGARAVLAQREPLNRINVFPVADNDTGSNLAATLDRVARGRGTSANREAGAPPTRPCSAPAATPGRSSPSSSKGSRRRSRE